MHRSRPLLTHAGQVTSWAESVADCGCVYQLPRPWQLEHISVPDPPQRPQGWLDWVGDQES
jgi:hypothetical protein